jgi:hypothetical protein
MAPIPRDIRSIVAPVAPATTRSVKLSSMTLKVSGWIRKSASTKHTTLPRASRAPPFRTAPMALVSTDATRAPRDRARAAVPSVEALSDTMTSIASAPPR